MSVETKAETKTAEATDRLEDNESSDKPVESQLNSDTVGLERLVLENEEEPSSAVTDAPLEDDPNDPDQEKDPKLTDDYVDEDALKLEEEKLSPDEISERLEKAKIYKDAGNEEFKTEKYRDSILTYTKGLLICPLCEKQLRSILYANRAAAKMKIKCKDLAVMDCTKSLEYNPTYLKALIRRATVYEELDKLDEALEDYKKIVELDPSYRDAVIATKRLPPLIQERNEKLKDEMLGKLKDLGNMILRPFGMSTENFQLEQQDGGGYSINFKK